MYLCININIHVRLPKIKFQVHPRLPKIKFYNLHAEVVWKTVPRAIIPPIGISTLLQISMSEQNSYFSGVNCFFFWCSMEGNNVHLSSQEIVALEDKYGCRNYEPVPAVLCRGQGECTLSFIYCYWEKTNKVPIISLTNSPIFLF